ncbi:S8 family peptidase [Rheinheimera texasensis]|uniref:S8 family peptidase n=1 Tax=Rheinheimera texasensis TaxID=306205 RepID=UPI00068FC6D8|nr:S8 family serine peptidase [Rheinheimera texasensis]
MKKLLIFSIGLLVAVTAAAQNTSAVSSFRQPVHGDGYLLQTTGPGGQTIRWYRQSKPKYLLELNKPGLYPALHQQALQQLKHQPVADVAVSAQQLRQTRQSLAKDPGLITALRQQIDIEQQQVIAAVRQLAGAQVEQQFSQLSNLLLVSGPVTQDQLTALPGVVRVWPEQAYQVSLSESVPKIKAPLVWAQKDAKDQQITGQGIRIAVLDTGVDYSHPALGGCVGASCKVILARNTVDNNDDVTDVHGHGTHVAAIAAGKADTGNGVAPDAQLIGVKVLNDQGYGYDSSIIAGIEYAVDPDGNPATDDGADIINMSLGGPGDAQSPISQAAERAVQAGVTVVVAAGNSYDYLTIGSPAAARSAITVANTDLEDRVNFSSSRGPLEGADYLKPEIAAPGTDIEAAKSGGGLKRLTGTSMAAPHVAGAAALLLQAQPQLTPLQVKQRLVQSADLINANPAEAGGGRLNVLNAVNQSFFLQETAVALGRVPNEPTVFSGSRQVTFINPTAQTVLVKASVLGQAQAGLKVTVVQSEHQVAPNSSATFDIQFNAQSEDINFPDNDGGVAGFQLAFDAGAQRLTVPVWYEKYQALQVQHDGSLVELRILDESLTERFYASGFSFGSAGTKQVRMTNVSGFKHIFGRLELSDPKDPHALGMMAALRIDFPVLTGTDTLVNMSSDLLTEYHRINNVEFLSQPYDFASGNISNSSFAILQNLKLAVPVLYSSRWCETPCMLKPKAMMFGGFSGADWSFEQTHEYPQPDISRPETRFFSWQGAVGNGPSNGEIKFDQNSLIQFGLLAGKVPVTGGGLSYGWPFEAKEGDVLRVYQAGPLLLPDTAPQIQSFSSGFNKDAHSGYFSASPEGSIRKWRMSETGPRQLVVAVDFNTNQLPLSSSLKVFTGAVSVGEKAGLLTMTQAPRNDSENWHFPVLWHDQYMNVGYFTDATQLEMRCDQTSVGRWGDLSYGNWFHYGRNCKEFVLQAEGITAKQLHTLPTVTYQIKSDGAFPRLSHLVLFNRQQLSDVVSRIDHRLNFDLTEIAGESSVKAIEVDFRVGNSLWRNVYKATVNGPHSARLPISAQTEVADLRIRVQQANGNQFEQILPEVLTIGASAGGDNDVDSDGILNAVDADNDNDGVVDTDDALPFDPTETTDTDKDGVGNNADPDDDNDGVADTADAFPLDPKESVDTDKDGIGNNADPDDDNDGTPDLSDAFPLDPLETTDTDKDGIGNNADPDDDNDGTSDVSDAFPLDPLETIDTDKDGIGNNADPDDDNDGTPDVNDAFPLDPAETLDTDKDGIGNNADPDDDNDGVADTADAFPLDPKESVDTDKDGIGNNADPDDDNDGVADSADAFPLDPKETTDTDKDGIGNNADPDDDNDGVADTADAFPLDPKETLDTDKDGIGNNADSDDDNDGVADTADAFPLDPKETLDTDKDGIGNNADPDDDNDGVADSSDKYPLDATRSSDPVTPDTGSSGSGGGGGAGLGGLLLGLPLLVWRRRNWYWADK